MPFASAFASLVVAELEDNAAARTCTASAVDIAEHRSESNDRLRALIGRSLMGSIAVS